MFYAFKRHKEIVVLRKYECLYYLACLVRVLFNASIHLKEGIRYLVLTTRESWWHRSHWTGDEMIVAIKLLQWIPQHIYKKMRVCAATRRQEATCLNIEWIITNVTEHITYKLHNNFKYLYPEWRARVWQRLREDDRLNLKLVRWFISPKRIIASCYTELSFLILAKNKLSSILTYLVKRCQIYLCSTLTYPGNLFFRYIWT